MRQLLQKERKQILRDPRMLRVVFVSPIVQLLVFGYAVNTDIRNTATFVVDRDHTADSRRLQETLTASGYFRIVGRSERPADLARALDRSQAVLGVDIPVGFASDLRSGRGASVQLLIDGTNSNTGTVARGYATRIVQLFGQERAAEGTGTAFASAATARFSAAPTPGPSPGNTSNPDPDGDGRSEAPARAGGIDLRARAWYNPDLESRVYNVPAVIGVVIMLMCLLLTAMAVVREREMGTLEQLMVSPLRPAELILAKTVPVALIALIDLALVCLVAVFWFDIPLRGSVADLLLAAAVYIPAGLSFGLLISTVSRTQQEAFMVMFLFFMPAMIISGFLYPVTTMPLALQWVSLLDPIRHFLEIVRGIFLKGEGVRELWPQYATLAAMAVAALSLAIRRFRKTLI
jgi:ABC-2 type transport system permease protein